MEKFIQYLVSKITHQWEVYNYSLLTMEKCTADSVSNDDALWLQSVQM